MIKHSMKKLFLLCMCSLGLYGTLFPQAPTETPIASPTVPTAAAAATAATSLAPPASTTAPASTATPAPKATAGSASSDIADRIHRKLEKKLGGKHGIIIDTNDGDHEGHNDDIPAMIIPLVGIVFLSIFGAPVLIVVMIGIFALLVSRSRQRTIRMLVEKGQPVPAELLAPAARSVRQRSDMRP